MDKKEQMETRKKNEKFYKNFIKVTNTIILVGIGMYLGNKAVNIKYDKILSGCDIFAFDAMEYGLKTKEFFELLTPAMRVAEKCPTQIHIV